MKLSIKKILFPIFAAAALFAFTGCPEDDDDDYDESGYDYEYEDDSDYDEWDENYDYDESEGYYDEYGSEDSYSSSGANSTSTSSDSAFGPLGNCGNLDGTTVVVSIFADDSKTSWNNAKPTDEPNYIKYMGIATNWIKKSASKYGCSSNFIYDYNSYPELKYSPKLKGDLLDEDRADEIVWDYIEKNINSKEIMEKFNANNILFMLVINTDSSNTSTSCTTSACADFHPPYEFVSIRINTTSEGYTTEECPAAYAHEILHAFGAPDLYSADTDGYNYGITQEYVNLMKSSQSNDIMYTTYDCYDDTIYYDRVSNELSELIAYYLGLTNSSSVQKQWGFSKSQHF